ncbi:hypothetical protein [Nocardioides litoris]|uniref:hypothetical protein n=1 Tax=Nocardioides litoris TaxID=1926648 RepID=UPI00111F77F9|nr:hypothetical protein [Nocardioides litoris]
MRSLDPGVPTWPVTGLSLVLGFAVAEVTGVRALGGVVLVLALAWCGLVWLGRGTRRPVVAGLVVLYLALFALSHVVAEPLGAWPSVALVAVVMAAATWAVADRASTRVLTP